MNPNMMGTNACKKTGRNVVSFLGLEEFTGKLAQDLLFMNSCC